MAAETFDEQIETITGALGDATRRGIYVMIREAHEPVTATQIAQAFDIHPNVARHHLDRLVDNEFIRISDRKPSQPTAGRPAKRYEVTEKAVTVQYSSRKYDRLAELLTTVIEQLDDGSALDVAERVGHDYGRELGTEIGSRTFLIQCLRAEVPGGLPLHTLGAGDHWILPKKNGHARR